MKVTEYEKKCPLSRSEYAFLMNLLCEDIRSSGVQVNYYYDTDEGFFRLRNTTVRIREKNGKYEGTVKKHMVGSDCSIEEPFQAESTPESFLLNGIAVHLQGRMETERTTVYLNGQMFLTLDRNRYLGTTDYEMELEYPPDESAEANGVMLVLQTLLQKNGTEPSSRPPEKSKRFFNRLLEQARAQAFSPEARKESANGSDLF